MPITAAEFEQARVAAMTEDLRQSTHRGPRYTRHGQLAQPWHDQYFAREFEPAGIVNCPQALRVGNTQSSLDVVLRTSNSNAGAVLFAAGSTVTLTLMQGDQEEGTFEDIGPAVCLKAPAAGKSIGPDEMVYRFPIGEFTKPWLMVTMEFAGAITGGKCDCALGYIPR